MKNRVTVSNLPASQYRKLLREGKIGRYGLGTNDEGRNRNQKPEARSPLRMGIDFTKAMSSGAATEELKVKRLAVCCGPCPTDQRYEKGEQEHRKACGCPAYPLSRLEFKAGLAMDTCLDGHWKNL